MQFEYADWMNLASRFSKEITDTVLETASGGCLLNPIKSATIF